MIALLPYDPCDALLARVAAVLRAGVPGCRSVTAGDHVAWEEADETSPAGHYLFPEGWRLFLDREPEEVEFPAVVLSIPENAKGKIPSLEGPWNVALQLDLITTRDGEIEELDTILARCWVVLTSELWMDSGALSLPQDRLSTDTFHVFGQRAADNFDGASSGKMEEVNDHPQRRLYIGITCAMRAHPSIIRNVTEDTTLPAADYTDRFDNYTFRQSTAGRSITLEAPTDGSRKAITVRNYGPTAFTLAPQGLSGGLTIAALSGPTILHWDASLGAWATGL